MQIQNFIDGQFVEPVGGRYLDNIEPATGKPYSKVPDSDDRDVELAVAAAEKAFPDWSRTPAAERSRILLFALQSSYAPDKALDALQLAMRGDREFEMILQVKPSVERGYPRR